MSVPDRPNPPSTPKKGKGPRAHKKGAPGRKPSKPVRPKKLFERAWPWLILVGVLAGGITVLALSLLRSAQAAVADASNRSFTLIAGVGSLAVVLMLTTGFYSARKRRRSLQEHAPGTMMAWLKAHVYLGLLAMFVVLLHAYLYPINTRITTGKITLFVLIVLVVSGIAWRIVYFAVPKRVAMKVGNLSVKDTASRLEQIQVEIEKATAGASAQLRSLVDARLVGKRKLADLHREAATLDPSELGKWEEFKLLAERRDRYRGREPKQERYHRILQGWKLLHLPLAAVLGAVIVIHILDVFGVGRRVLANDAADRFPSSAQCADCHSEIVRQWMLALHSDAQLMPTTVAQTELAVEKNAELGLDVGRLCTNCHAPIGTQISRSNVFPLPGESHGDQILSEGVTCWACHSVKAAPQEVRGAQDDFPVAAAGTRSFGTVFNPPVGEPLPVPDHQVAQGFMTSQIAAFDLCGACHDVKVDLDGGGFSPIPNSDGSGVDTDGNGILDENELAAIGRPRSDVDGSDIIGDLVLQTTFDEWQDFLKSGRTETCATCHMLPTGGQIVDAAPGGLSLPDRQIHSHEFVGVDYNLTPDHYSGLGVGGGDGLQEVQLARTKLIQDAATLEVRDTKVTGDVLSALIRVRPGFIGHNFPSGFAFARQWWLEVSAQTADGTPVCLEPVNPLTRLADPNGIAAPCVSGHIANPRADLQPCDPPDVADAFGTELNAGVHLSQPAPIELAHGLDTQAQPASCDPWLANFQKILTDGDPDGDGQFFEVPYQTLLPDIVKNEIRVADQTPMGALTPYKSRFDHRDLAYLFNVSQVHGQDVTINVVMHFRHLPPYFLRALDGFYPNGLTGEILLKQMVVTDVQSAPPETVSVP